jgi:hypothetical protein
MTGVPHNAERIHEERLKAARDNVDVVITVMHIKVQYQAYRQDIHT